MAGTNTTIGGGGLHHIALRARNFDRTLGFYREVLGCTAAMEWGEAPKRAVMLDTGEGNYVEVFERPDAPAPNDEPTLLHFALRTSDCDKATEQVRAAGYPVTMEPASIDMPTAPEPTLVRISFCTGPDGETIEFFQLREA
jgi:glyoxylase I family protein